MTIAARWPANSPPQNTHTRRRKSVVVLGGQPGNDSLVSSRPSLVPRYWKVFTLNLIWETGSDKCIPLGNT